MKRIEKITKLVGICMALFLSPDLANAQCNSADYAEKCISSLDTTYNYIKSFTLDGQGGDATLVEHSYVFTTNTDYLINWCSMTSESNSISLEILDQNRVSVANSAEGTQGDQLTFTCLATGIYYLRYTFNATGDYCGGSAMGFKQSNP